MARSRPAPFKAWKKAEPAIGHAARTRKVLRGLPPEQGRLLLVMDVLHRGRRSDLVRMAAQAREAGDGALAAVLEVLLAPAEQLDPTRVRREAKKAGTGLDVGFPYLDLLRQLAAWRSGRAPKSLPAPALARTAKERPLLAVAVDAQKGPGLRTPSGQRKTYADWPRAFELWLAARYVQNDPHARGAGRRPVSPSERSFPRSDWPDLAVASQESLLARCLEADTLDPALLASCKGVFRQLDQAQQRRWLRRMLQRLPREVRSGSSSGARLLAGHVREIASRLGLGELAQMTIQLEISLERLREPDEPHAGLLLELWKKARSWSGQERLEIARELLEADPDEVGPLRICEAALCVISQSDDEKEQLRWLEALATILPPSECEHALRHLDAARRLRLMGRLYVERGELGAARQVFQQLLPLQAEPALRLLQKIVQVTPRRSEKASRRCLAAKAPHLAQGQAPCGALVAVLVAVRRQWGAGLGRKWGEMLRPALVASLPQAERDLPSSGPQLGPRGAELLVGQLLADDVQAAGRCWRLLTRRLRRPSDGDQGRRAVLTLLTFLLGLGQALGVEGKLGAWPDALLSFLQRPDRPGVGALADPFAYQDDLYLEGLVRLRQRFRGRLGTHVVWEVVEGLKLLREGEGERSWSILQRIEHRTDPGTRLGRGVRQLVRDLERDLD